MLKFLCIGAQKAGTSWLYAQMKQHPELALGKKEVHFWDWYYQMGIPWYKEQFADQKPQGDLTPAYASMAPEQIAECHAHFPDLRLIYIVREPVARAWSSLLYLTSRFGIDPPELSDRTFLEILRTRAMQLRGNYALCREHWLRQYAPGQLLILHFDDIAKKPKAVVERCCEHIGIARHVPAKEVLEAKYRQGPGTPVRASLRPALQEIYGAAWDKFQPFIERV